MIFIHYDVVNYKTIFKVRTSKKFGLFCFIYGFVAQMVLEHSAFNGGVVSSNLTGVTVTVAQLVERLIVIQEVAGS